MSISLKSIVRRALPHPVYRLYRQRKVAHERSSYTRRVVEHDYAGHRLKVALTDRLAEGWYDHDWDEPAEMSLLREHGVLREGATVFDLGAHQGVVGLILARQVGESGRVVAVEAEAHNASAAKHNATLNHAHNMTVIHAAASDTTEPLLFAEGLNGHVDQSTSIGNTRLHAVTVDSLAEEYGTPELVYVDVEGYEQKVLAGAAATLRAGAAFFIEIHDTLGSFGGSPRAIAEMLRGYEFFTAVGSGSYTPFDGAFPDGRFFLAALPG